MPHNTLSSLKVLKISLLSGTGTIVLSWVEILDSTAASFKSIGIICTGAVAVWSAGVYFRLELQKIRQQRINKKKSKDDTRSS